MTVRPRPPHVPHPAKPAAPTKPTPPTPVKPGAPPVLTGPLAAQGTDTFQQLKSQASGLSPRDAAALAKGTTQLGVIGEAEALKGAQLAQQLSPADQTTFRGLVSQASSDTAVAFLYKALAAGHTVAEVQAFAGQIKGMSDAQLVDQLSLADDAGADGAAQDGVKQQFEASCVATTAQALRGESDPIYALSVRQQNANINGAVDTDATQLNPSLAAEQKALLEGPGGGLATNRSDDSGAGVMDAKLADVFNAETAHTGFTYQSVFSSDVTSATQADALCDGMAKQLAAGIATPLKVTSDQNMGGHAILACAVEGTGASQKFLVHDPWEGTSTWITRTQIEQGTFSVAGWNRLGAYEQATPAPAPAPAPAL